MVVQVMMNDIQSGINNKGMPIAVLSQTMLKFPSMAILDLIRVITLLTYASS